MTIFNYAEISQGLGLPKESQTSTFNLTKAKSLVGIGVPNYTKAHRRQQFNLAGFFMRTICTRLFFVSALMRSRPYYGGLVEATSVGRFLCDGYANLDQFTTSLIGVFGGDYKHHTKEAATVATTPTQKPFNVYTFAIGNPKRTIGSFKHIRTISTVAQTERQARANLKGLRLTFMKCLPSNAQEVAA